MSTANNSAVRATQSRPASGANERTVVHSTFCIERTYAASPAQVYHALTDPIAKAKWFTGGERFTLLARSMDVRAGGREHLQGRWGAGTHRDASDGREGIVHRGRHAPAGDLDQLLDDRLRVPGLKALGADDKSGLNLLPSFMGDAGGGVRMGHGSVLQ